MRLTWYDEQKGYGGAYNMHQSCASLVNASASLNVIAEISAELQGERQKNAELMERIMVLEAQLQERQKVLLQS
nr:uncharacterized protein LOC109167286 [Ipomoea batatas]GMC89828.1 uncharacterized protein LOC109167286 [Ipomoea batatas]